MSYRGFASGEQEDCLRITFHIPKAATGKTRENVGGVNVGPDSPD
jgi:hypothetical protein